MNIILSLFLFPYAIYTVGRYPSDPYKDIENVIDHGHHGRIVVFGTEISRRPKIVSNPINRRLDIWKVQDTRKRKVRELDSSALAIYPLN